jgi:hypothetical protein
MVAVVTKVRGPAHVSPRGEAVVTALIAWLIHHHIHYRIVGGTAHRQHLEYLAFHSHCSHLRQLTAWADYGHRVVAYCYPRNA